MKFTSRDVEEREVKTKPDSFADLSVLGGKKLACDGFARYRDPEWRPNG